MVDPGQDVASGEHRQVAWKPGSLPQQQSPSQGSGWAAWGPPGPSVVGAGLAHRAAQLVLFLLLRPLLKVQMGLQEEDWLILAPKPRGWGEGRCWDGKGGFRETSPLHSPPCRQPLLSRSPEFAWL